MILRLTGGQLNECIAVGTKRHRRYLGNGFHATTNYVLVNMPAAGVRSLIAEFEQVTFTPKWGKRKARTPMIRVRTLSALARHLNEWMCHPGFHGQAMPDVSTDVLAAWVTGYRQWSPFPGGKFEILVPEVKPWKLAGGSAQITTWKPGSVTHCTTEILDETEHQGW